MSNNKELTQLEREGLMAAGLPVDTPSQLSDAFRLGMAHLQKQNNELKYQLKIRDDLSCKTCKGAGTVMIAIDDGIDCPECVELDNKIKAEAVIEAIEKCNANSQEEDSGERLIYVSDLVDHVNRIKDR